jgi:hypothetical protein
MDGLSGGSREQLLGAVGILHAKEQFEETEWCHSEDGLKSGLDGIYIIAALQPLKVPTRTPGTPPAKFPTRIRTRNSGNGSFEQQSFESQIRRVLLV